jgi:hypothetical protein
MSTSAREGAPQEPAKGPPGAEHDYVAPSNRLLAMEPD